MAHLNSQRVAWIAAGWTGRLIVGGLFLYAAWSKLGDPVGFARDLRGYIAVPDTYTAALALAIPLIEVCTALLLLIGLWRRRVRILIFLILVAFTTLKLYALAHGHDLTCGCFGDSYLGRVAVGWVGVYLNFAMMAALFVDGYGERRLCRVAPAPADAGAAGPPADASSG